MNQDNVKPDQNFHPKLIRQVIKTFSNRKNYISVSEGSKETGNRDSGAGSTIMEFNLSKKANFRYHRRYLQEDWCISESYLIRTV